MNQYSYIQYSIHYCIFDNAEGLTKGPEGPFWPAAPGEPCSPCLSEHHLVK